eukprot:1177440-Prorocentrum_minimum.AAC.1
MICAREGAPIRRRKHGYILTMDQSDAGVVGTEFSPPPVELTHLDGLVVQLRVGHLVEAPGISDIKGT